MPPSTARWISTSLPACSRETPDSTNTPIVELSTSSASASSEEARLAAAAGLFSSCARPAAIVPSDSSRSRFCSIAVIRPTTGRTCASTRCMIERLATASSRKSSGAIAARRRSDLACTRTPSGEPVSAAIAPIQVGASVLPRGLLAAVDVPEGLRRALQQQVHGVPVSPSCGDQLAGPVLVQLGARGDRRELPRRRAPRTGRSRAAPRRTARSCARQVLVDQRYRHRALADGAGDALDRPRADVARDEHPRHARLERVRLARPAASRDRAHRARRG